MLAQADHSEVINSLSILSSRQGACSDAGSRDRRQGVRYCVPGTPRAEVVAGTVVQLDADGLRAAGHSKTNAEMTLNEDRAVAGEHSEVGSRLVL